MWIARRKKPPLAGHFSGVICFHFILFLSQNSEKRMRYHICLEVRMKEFAVCMYVEIATG